MPPVEFAREALGWHEDGPDGVQHPLSLLDWQATAVEVSPPQSAPVFFVTVGPDGAGCVAVAYSHEGRPHAELVDRRPGVSWLASVLEELHTAWPASPFGAGKAGPVAGLVEAGEVRDVLLLTGGELAQACVHHEGLNKARGYTHTADPDLDLSLAGAVSKPAGDGMWTWNWRASVNLAPVAGVSGALWLLETRPAYDLLDSVR